MAKDMFLYIVSAILWGGVVFVKIERLRSRPWRIFAWAMFLFSVAGVVVALLDATGLLSRL
jgi:hypothetical protein